MFIGAETIFSDAQEWKGKWFPRQPDAPLPILDPNMIGDDMTNSNMIRTNRIKTMGISDPDCDDAQVACIEIELIYI